MVDADDSHPRAALAPVFIVAPPRAGARLLYSVLSQVDGVCFRDDNAPDSVDQLAALHPSSRDWTSGRLDRDAAAAISREDGDRLATVMLRGARDRDDAAVPDGATEVTLLEASARHALRVPFLAQVFPSARFVLMARHAGPSVSSLAEAWRSGRFIPYPRLPDWTGQRAWAYPLIEGWRELADREPHEIAAIQWQRVTDLLLDDLSALDADRWTTTSYEALIQDPQDAAEQLCSWLGATWDRELRPPLPVTASTVSPPRPGKWRERDVISRVLPSVQPTATRVADLIGVDTTADTASPRAASSPDTARASAPGLPEAGFGSDYTASVPELLRQIDASVLVSTYQSGRVILARAEPEGGGLNTHFRTLSVPMGMAVDGNRIAIGTRHAVTTYLDHPRVAAKLAPSGRYDGCFLPLSSHTTGDIRVHDLAWAGGELWAVSTRFSALVTVGGEASFMPRWQPPFVSALAAEDRCHLNGCAVVEDKVKFVTALGETDAPGGWRDDKAKGGIIIDVDSGEIMSRGLSMPHSPRWYDGNLWVLESGKGEIGVVDLLSGRVQTVAALPGFTRGLTFAGPYALVGLSEVRESVFRGLPIAQRQARECGVWVVDIRNGSTVGYLRFTGSVNEIFDVQLLRGYRWPELAETGTSMSDDAFVLPDVT
ncbi:MAG TPA: TIGR03032 family protein [Mycobacteriales bacterium]|nr:TIGR03032 family protein [Mycobacteriales bacterium]